ncbi:hypothetical protein EYF80_028520 [Liparis tanakae]|uniref:Uncharacterized protein n=1 Tax=Liparis tanakae TaxID=230148 RepID=A0A4Z2H7L4_9TELE|nr:hypothetical protein EYF80_028520 [Liparis tanakae]
MKVVLKSTRIFLGKPGLLLSMDEGGDGSCVAMASAGTSHLGGENVGGRVGGGETSSQCNS